MLLLVFFLVPLALGLVARELATGRTDVNFSDGVPRGCIPQERESGDGVGWGSRRILGAEETGIVYRRSDTLKIWTQ